MINILKKDWSRVMFWLWNLKAKSHANYIGLIKKHLYGCMFTLTSCFCDKPI